MSTVTASSAPIASSMVARFRNEGVGVVVAEGPTRRVEDLLLELVGAVDVTLDAEGLGEVIHRGEGVWVVVAAGPTRRVEDLFLEFAGASLQPVRT